LKELLEEKFKNDYLPQEDSEKPKGEELKLKIKEELISKDEELESQIKNKIAQIEDEITTLRGKHG